jgi:hypothetical protein
MTIAISQSHFQARPRIKLISQCVPKVETEYGALQLLLDKEPDAVNQRDVISRSEAGSR